jgi:hypothetical protein
MMQEQDSLEIERRQSEISVAEENQQFAQVSHQKRECGFAFGSAPAFVRNIVFPAQSLRLLLNKL